MRRVAFLLALAATIVAAAPPANARGGQQYIGRSGPYQTPNWGAYGQVPRGYGFPAQQSRIPGQTAGYTCYMIYRGRCYHY